LAALATFNGVVPANMMFGDVYDRWAAQHMPGMSAHTESAYRSRGARLDPLRPVRMSDLTADRIDGFLRGLDCTDGVRALVAGLVKMVLTYAYKKGYAPEDIAGRMDAYTKPAPTINRKLFTSEEVKTLWNDGSPYAKAALIALYGGWRPGEVMSLTPAQVDLEKMVITAGSKTDAGKDRTVPIHSAIQDLVRDLVKDDPPVLFSFGRTSYAKFFAKIGHTPHDTRHTFATVSKDCGMDAVARKKFLGHAIKDITESVYTHQTPEHYREEMEKLHY
jgi:integrase